MPWRRIATTPVMMPSPADAAMPMRMPSSGGTPHTLTAWAVTYPPVPKNIACPNDSKPPYPIRRLKAHASSAKHSPCITKKGERPVRGTTNKSAVMIANAIISSRIVRGVTGKVSSVIAVMLGRPSRQSRWFHQQHQHHQNEYHGVGGFRIEVLGQALDQAQCKAGNDRPHDRSHAADHHHREHHDDDVLAHQRPDLVDWRRQHTRQRRQTNAKAIGQRDHSRYIDAESAHQRRVFG